jgi:peptidyl-prolyl cis-trans isomerase A (cyclophilin A)
MAESFFGKLFGRKEDNEAESSVPPVAAAVKTSEGTMVLQLFEERVPNTVANFVHLATKGFYDGLTFHRVIEGFMVQAGCPEGTGTGGPGWQIADEIVDGLRHDSAGTLSMANAGPDTNGSQFFITLAPTPWLDGQHTVFGQVVKGMDVLERIGSVETDERDGPLEPVLMEKVAIFRDGERVAETQPMPETL